MYRPLRSLALLSMVVVLAGCGTTGSLTGTTPVGDTTPPTVTAVVPASDATVPAETQITVTFSKPMNTRSATISAEPQAAFGPAQWSADERSVSFKPQAPLSPGTRYTVTVTAQDRAGNPAASHRWTFTAGAPGGRAGTGAARLAQRFEVRADPRVFTLFAALNAAGYEAGASESGPVRNAIRTASGDLPLKAVDPFRKYWSEHPLALEAYVRYALDVGDPPEFAEQRAPQGLERLNRVLAAFYDSAGVAAWWNTHRQAYDAAAAAAAAEGPKVIGGVFDYARASELPADRIVVIPNLLDDPGAAYLVRQPQRVAFVVGWHDGGATSPLTLLAARLALEKLPDGAAAELKRTEALYPLARDLAQKEGWTSWAAVVRESLAAAVTARLALPEERRAEYLRRRYARGLILVDHFTRELPRYERSTVPLVDFLPELLASVDLAEEQRVFATRKP
ncbi:MAG TPA: Ig-like domain-containing protein [bacterium]|nr:Ig-like domain-containing protein [bacterium]